MKPLGWVRSVHHRPPNLLSLAKNRGLSLTRAERKTSSSRRRNKVTNQKKQPDLPEAEKEPESSFKTCGEAIGAGLELFQKGAYDEALDAFAESLELPGEGRFRLEGRAKEFSGPSKSQEDSALYNMTCCHSKLGEFDSALTCLEALLESGFENYDALRNDADLQDVRNVDGRFEEMIKRFDSMPAKLSKMLQNRASAKKPWLI